MSTIKWLNHLPGNGVYSLREAQNSLLQVLLTEFHLVRDGHRFTLKVSFKESDPAIRRREAKKHIQNCMPGHPDKVAKVQAQINAVFSGDKSEYPYADPDFAFRYASGGTLPVVEYDSAQYYCLFYRDEFPVGWNIANGACDSLSELLNPKLAIERELREELIILNLSQHLDYKFTWQDEVPVAAMEFVDAKKLAKRFLAGEPDIRKFKRPKLKVDWSSSPGPDVLQFTFERDDGDVTDLVQEGYYLNITAKDFGIELDCIARIQLPQSVTLLDGEINENKLLNRPIGLFEVRKTQAAVGSFEVNPQELVKRSTEFMPDHLFHSTRKINRFPSSPKEFDKEIIEGEFLRYLQTVGFQGMEDRKKKREEVPLSERFDLCPVTLSIIQRHKFATSLQVFMSYSHKDRSFAEQLEQDLTSRNIKVWRDTKGMGRANRIDVPIEQALKDCSYVLLLVSQHSRDSEFVCKEVQYACNVQKPGIAVMLEHCLPPFVATLWPQIDFHDRYQEPLNELVHALFSKSNE